MSVRALRRSVRKQLGFLPEGWPSGCFHGFGPSQIGEGGPYYVYWYRFTQERTGRFPERELPTREEARLNAWLDWVDW